MSPRVTQKGRRVLPTRASVGVTGEGGGIAADGEVSATVTACPSVRATVREVPFQATACEPGFSCTGTSTFSTGAPSTVTAGAGPACSEDDARDALAQRGGDSRGLGAGVVGPSALAGPRPESGNRLQRVPRLEESPEQHVAATELEARDGRRERAMGHEQPVERRVELPRHAQVHSLGVRSRCALDVVIAVRGARGRREQQQRGDEQHAPPHWMPPQSRVWLDVGRGGACPGGTRGGARRLDAEGEAGSVRVSADAGADGGGADTVLAAGTTGSEVPAGGAAEEAVGAVEERVATTLPMPTVASTAAIATAMRARGLRPCGAGGFGSFVNDTTDRSSPASVGTVTATCVPTEPDAGPGLATSRAAAARIHPSTCRLRSPMRSASRVAQRRSMVTLSARSPTRLHRVLQGVAHRLRRGEAIGRRSLEGSVHEGAHGLRDVVRQRVDGVGADEERAEDRRVVRPFDGRTSGDELVEHGPRTPYVGASVDGASLGLFGSHVPRLALHEAGARLGGKAVAAPWPPRRSMSFTMPVSVRSTFCGETSRCTT